MSQDEFTKMFNYIQTEFGALNERFDKTDKRIDSYAGAVDAFAKQNETYMQEMLAIAHKVDRLEAWIHQIADATGVKLSVA